MYKRREPPKPKQPAQAPAAPADSQADSKAAHSGQVQFDDRGNAVWEWQTETGKFSADINTQRLQKLVDSELSLEQTGKVKKLDGLSLDETFSGKGFNPYDHAKSQPKSPDPYQKRYQNPLNTKPAPPPAHKPIKDLKAYGEWLAMKKRLAEQKDKDKD